MRPLLLPTLSDIHNLTPHRGQGERTLILSAVLSKKLCLIYSLACPTCQRSIARARNDRVVFGLAAPILFPRRVENNGFEPLTPCLQSRCSSQLS